MRRFKAFAICLIFATAIFCRPALAWDPNKPFIYEMRIAFETDNWINMYSTATVLSKSDNSEAFRVVAYSTTTPTYQLVVTTQGNVGIGTASPQQKLEISGNDTGDGYQLPLVRLSNLYSSGVGSSLEWFSGYGNKVTGRIYTYAHGTSGAAFGLDLLDQNTATMTQRVAIDNNGNVGIGTIYPGSYRLRVAGGSAAVDSGQSWTTASDIRLKKDVSDLGPMLDKVLGLRGVRYHTKEEKSSDAAHIGFIAQEVEKRVPEVVVTGADGYKGIDYGRITAVLVEAVKEQQKKIEQLETRLKALEQKR